MADKKLKEAKELIVETLSSKASLKQKIYDNTLGVMEMLKEVLHEITTDINLNIKGLDKRIRLEYSEKGKFEAEMRMAGDVLIFSMHSNIFEFDRDHSVWKLSYVQDDKMRSYCGIINIYNFLSDSFKYNRYDDLGYLIGRIFVNKDMHYFVEGKRQMGFLYSNFGSSIIDKVALRKIVETSMLYTLEFDLLVPPYDNVKIASVAQVTEKIENSKVQTGKRLGYKFNSDDVLEEK
ncbi:MAG TPA: hypothetical protein VMW01_08745 [Williamwhitmania sp.]|jgi:hypothetical protein|nr:hypothetical protein [Williamwhitmania sp.]